MKVKLLSRVQLLVTPWTAAYQAPLSMGFSRQEYFHKGSVQSVQSLSHVRLFATPWTAAYQAPPSMGFSRKEYWSGVPLPSIMTAVRVSAVRVPYISTAVPMVRIFINLSFSYMYCCC